MRQFKPGPEWIVKDELTTPIEQLSLAISNIRKYIHFMIMRVRQQHLHQQQEKLAASQSGADAGPKQTKTSNPAALNAQNLQHLQQQEEEALRKNRRASSQAGSVAGSVAGVIPTAPFGAPSPSGVPHIYGPGGFTPEKLRIPPNKRRKPSNTQGQAETGGAAPGKAASLKQEKQQQAKPEPPAVAPAMASHGLFKCSVVECQHHYRGFATQGLLDKHVEENHKTEEPIENPVEFALESFRMSLLKDDDKAEDQDTKIVPTSAEMQRVGSKTSAQAVPLVKDGATPSATNGATPMARAPSQLGPKSVSPNPNQQPTAGQSANQPPKPVGPKQTTNKEIKKENGKPLPTEPTVAEDTTTTTTKKDEWADSSVSLEAIQDAFTDLGDDSLGMGETDLVDEFLNPEVFSNGQSQETPDSVDTGGTATRTPKDNEVATKADFDFKVGDVSDDNWVPVDWINVHY